jgi:hypothetical protein
MDVVLFHGALGSAAQLAQLQELLTPNVKTHVVEFEDHGNTPPGDRPFLTGHFTENVLQCMSSAGLQRAVLFGYTMSRLADE